MNYYNTYKNIFNMLKNDKLQFGFKIHNVKFAHEILNDFKIYQMVSKINEFNCPGLGIDKQKYMAITKAVFEYYERRALIEYGFNSGVVSTNGMAAHVVESIAYNTAKLELIERDAFLKHWYSKKPFSLVNKKNLNYITTYIEFLKTLNLKTLILSTNLGYRKTYVCFLVNSRGGFTIGLSAKENECEAVEKAFTEALINEFFGHANVNANKIHEEVVNGKFLSLLHHRYLWREILILPDWVLNSINIDICSLKEINPKIIFKQKYGLIHILKLSHDELIDLEVGMPSFKTLNKLKKSISIDINQTIQLIHPIP